MQVLFVISETFWTFPGTASLALFKIKFYSKCVLVLDVFINNIKKNLHFLIFFFFFARVGIKQVFAHRPSILQSWEIHLTVLAAVF